MFEDDPEQIRLLFACEACSHGECWECVHFAGAWCPHRCWWLYEIGLPDGRNDPRPDH